MAVRPGAGTRIAGGARLDPSEQSIRISGTRSRPGFHDDDVDFVLFEDCLQVIPLGGRIKEGMFPSFRVKKTAHSIELA